MAPSPRIPRRSARPVRRGGGSVGLLVTLVLFGGMAVTAVVVTPRYLRAGGTTPLEVVAAREPGHQQVLDAFASLLGRCREVIAVHQRSGRPYLEVVVWLEDARHPGQVDAEELAVISHSAVLRTVALHTLAPPGPGRRDADVPAQVLVRGSDIRAPSFCDAWRARPDVTRRVLAAGVSELEAEVMESTHAERVMLRISFTWAEETADAADAASAFVDARMRRRHE